MIRKCFDSRYVIISACAMAFRYYACDLGDTLSSELGELSTSPPVFITRPWKVVPKGGWGYLWFFLKNIRC